MGERTDQAAPSRELLLANHAFPGEYIVKAFGPETEAFRTAIVACAHAVVGEARVAVAARSSRHGRRVCVTLSLQVETVDEVLRVYGEINSVPELMLIL